ncbi:hypothetical protein CCR85_01235 [Rhodothalassium salexigens]|uniref:phage tail protein n=1 Tax=Rhodothalassium salexigens TaxID=1086 RepID=UPI001911AF5C|nr:phage tail protein [Rhodothalassium salexigens]MBK5910116.1 hypothetical protein [Rhodothalassium salexigens]MBK5920729.1 hypothetical protein [Rhodothalassium salexigens]
MARHFAPDLRVEHRLDDAVAFLDRLGSKRWRRAVMTAINRAGASTRSQAASTLAKAMGTKVRRVRQDLRLVQARHMDEPARVRAVGKSLGLMDFAARQTRIGVTARAYGVSRRYRGAFIAQRHGTDRVFIRIGKERHPLHRLYGPSVPETMADPAIHARLVEHGVERLAVEIARQMDRALYRKHGRR